MISTEIPINFARKELTNTQFQRRCDKLLKQKFVNFDEWEKEEIGKIRQTENIDFGIHHLKTLLSVKIGKINKEADKSALEILRSIKLNSESLKNFLNKINLLQILKY